MENDDKPALSFEDETFLKVIEKESPRPRLPNNHAHALSCLHSLRRTLSKNPKMNEQFVAFMEKLFLNWHVEEAPLLLDSAECRYLPIFGVYHPQKFYLIQAHKRMLSP